MSLYNDLEQCGEFAVETELGGISLSRLDCALLCAKYDNAQLNGFYYYQLKARFILIVNARVVSMLLLTKHSSYIGQRVSELHECHNGLICYRLGISLKSNAASYSLSPSLPGLCHHGKVATTSSLWHYVKPNNSLIHKQKLSLTWQVSKCQHANCKTTNLTKK